MNWVGGSRNRLVMKNDAKRQREFFEKRKMQQRLRNLGISLPASPGSSSGSLDLVTLFIVNQIAAKKENKGPPKVAVLGSSKGGSRHKRNEPLVLPMSPCSPSQLSLVESQPQCSVQGARRRKQILSQGFKQRQLSPVLESAFSDKSASDYLPPITNGLSPFSTSSVSSGQGMFPLQLNLQQRHQTQAQLHPHSSPPPWDTSGLVQTKFRPFSQPRDMRDSMSWSCGSNVSETQVLFACPEPDTAEARDHVRHKATFSLNQSENREPTLDFTFNQSETEQHYEEDIFRGFSSDGCEREGFGRGQSKIYLKDETAVKSSTPQTVPDPQCLGVELSNCTDVNLACLDHNNDPMNGCDCSPSYSCQGGYLSSDSTDDDESCLPCLQVSYMDRASCSDSLYPNLGSQVNPEQRHNQPRLLSPLLKPTMNVRDDQTLMVNVACPDKNLKTQTSEPCKCNKTCKDAGTQTVNNSTSEMRDASTQCSLVADGATAGSNMCLPPVDVSVQHPATGRQTDAAADLNTHSPSSSQVESRGKNTPWRKMIFRAGSPSNSSFINKFAAHNSGANVIQQRPTNPFTETLSITDGRGKENGEGKRERRQQENDCVMENLSNEERVEVTSAAGVNRLSEKAEALEEIADILVLLKQGKTERW